MDSQKAVRQLKEMEKLSHAGIRLAAEEWKEDWQTLISTMLSARTRDETTIVVSTKLFKKYNSPKALASASLKDIQNMIYSVNFYRNKSKNVSACAKALVKDYNGKVPHDFDKLIKLPGVGRKTANVFLSEVGKHTIGVDTHVGYISKYLGWTKHTDQKKVEEDIKRLFPHRHWGIVNRILVRFGKTHRSRRKENELLDKLKKIN
jgi:endonuclease-3